MDLVNRVLRERKCADWLGLLGFSVQLLVLNQVIWTEASGGSRVGGGRCGNVDQTISGQNTGNRVVERQPNYSLVVK